LNLAQDQIESELEIYDDPSKTDIEDPGSSLFESFKKWKITKEEILEVQIAAQKAKAEAEMAEAAAKAEAEKTRVTCLGNSGHLSREKIEIIEGLHWRAYLRADSLKGALQSKNFNEQEISAVMAGCGWDSAVPESLKRNASALKSYLSSASNGFRSNAKFISGIPLVVGHVVKEDIFVRECYEAIFAMIEEVAKERPVVVCGDPGIGKSLFSTYVFCKLVMMKQSVVHISNGGCMLVYDTPNDKLEVFTEIDVGKVLSGTYWVLIDGSAPVRPFADIKARAVVFASPNQRNYHEFAKDNGAIFYMSAWSAAEVEELVDQLPIVRAKKFLKCWQGDVSRFLELDDTAHQDQVPFEEYIDLMEEPHARQFLYHCGNSIEKGH
jgi:hypothetical protein